MSAEIEPAEVANIVEQYVDSELRDAEQYSNRSPLDESGIWSLHQLAARAYALGFAAGETTTAIRESKARLRQREAAKGRES